MSIETVFAQLTAEERVAFYDAASELRAGISDPEVSHMFDVFTPTLKMFFIKGVSARQRTVLDIFERNKKEKKP